MQNTQHNSLHTLTTVFLVQLPAYLGEDIRVSRVRSTPIPGEYWLEAERLSGQWQGWPRALVMLSVLSLPSVTHTRELDNSNKSVSWYYPAIYTHTDIAKLVDISPSWRIDMLTADMTNFELPEKCVLVEDKEATAAASCYNNLSRVA